MRYRKKMSRSSSRRVFRKGAKRIHRKNGHRSMAMRGGIRL